MPNAKHITEKINVTIKDPVLILPLIPGIKKPITPPAKNNLPTSTKISEIVFFCCESNFILFDIKIRVGSSQPASSADGPVGGEIWSQQMRLLT